MENNLISSDEVAFFESNGYLVLPSGRVFTNDQIEHMRKDCEKIFPPFSEEISLLSANQKVSNPNLGLNGNIKNYLFDPKDSNTLKKNPLFGKRASMIAPKFPKVFVDAIENENLLAVNRQLLNSKDLSLHNSAVACVYPGCVGEPGNFHADTSGFSDDPLKAVKLGKFMINSFIYLVDVDEENAPIRVLPQSHRKYLELNELVAPNFHSTKYENNIGQFNFYDEFIPESYPKPISVTGKAGSIVLLSGNLLHSATRNCSKSRIRYTLAIWFSARKDKEFYKDYSSYGRHCIDFIEKFKDKKIPYKTYFLSSISLRFKIKKIIGKFLKGGINRLRKFSKKSFLKEKWKVIQPVGNIFIKKNFGTLSDSSFLYLDHLLSNYDDAKLRLVDFINNQKEINEIYFVAPNATSFLELYKKKDYRFFESLPLKQYFYDESWPRYIVRYFSNIVSSFASEEQCKACLTINEESFFKNLTQIENDFLSRNFNVSEIENDIPKSRWNEDSLKKILLDINLNIKETLPQEKIQVSQLIGGNPEAWVIVKAEFNN